MKELHDYRKSQSLSQHDLAALIGVSQPTICEYENGKKRPSPFVAKRIELITGIPRETLRPDIYA